MSFPWNRSLKTRVKELETILLPKPPRRAPEQRPGESDLEYMGRLLEEKYMTLEELVGAAGADLEDEGESR